MIAVDLEKNSTAFKRSRNATSACGNSGKPFNSAKCVYARIETYLQYVVKMVHAMCDQSGTET